MTCGSNDSAEDTAERARPQSRADERDLLTNQGGRRPAIMKHRAGWCAVGVAVLMVGSC
jgi:hypothetical protein